MNLVEAVGVTNLAHQFGVSVDRLESQVVLVAHALGLVEFGRSGHETFVFLLFHISLIKRRGPTAT